MGQTKEKFKKHHRKVKSKEKERSKNSGRTKKIQSIIKLQRKRSKQSREEQTNQRVTSFL
jgi:hypothetical protein